MRSIRVLVLAAAIATAFVGGLAEAQVTAAAVQGDWSGSIMGTLPLVLHVRAGAAGALTATMDSPTQGAMGLQATNVTLTGAAFRFDVPSVKGSYEGTLGASGKTITGTWTQGQEEPLEWKQTRTGAEAAAEDARRAAELAKLKPSPIDGSWTGALSAGGQTLRLAFHFHAVPEGIAGTLDSLDQNAMGIPCTNIEVNGQKVTLTVPAVHGSYEGRLSADGKHIDGTWTQGSPLDLNLTKQ